MKQIKLIAVNLNDGDSIKEAELVKKSAELQGYTLNRTLQDGLDCFIMEYVREAKK